MDEAFFFNSNPKFDMFGQAKMFSKRILKFVTDNELHSNFLIDYVAVIDHILSSLLTPSFRNDSRYSNMFWVILIQFISKILANKSFGKHLVTYIQLFSLGNLKNKSTSLFESMLLTAPPTTNNKRNSLSQNVNFCFSLYFSNAF